MMRSAALVLASTLLTLALFTLQGGDADGARAAQLAAGDATSAEAGRQRRVERPAEQTVVASRGLLASESGDRLRAAAQLDRAREAEWASESLAALRERSRALREQAERLANETDALLVDIDRAVAARDAEAADAARARLATKVRERQALSAELAIVGLLRLERQGLDAPPAGEP